MKYILEECTKISHYMLAAHVKTTARVALVLLGLLILSGLVTAQNPITSDPSNPTKIAYSESIPYRPRVFAVSPDQQKKKDKRPLNEAAPIVTQPTPAPSVIAENKPLTLRVSVLDSDGKPVTGLSKSDFTLLVDAQKMEIASFETVAEPTNFIFLIDTSGSTDEQIKLIQQNALKLAEQLGPDDKAMVIRFDTEVHVLSELTGDRKRIEKAIRDAKLFGNGTSLYDTIDSLFEKYVSGIIGLKAVVLFTDGVDTTSRRMRYDASLLAAEKGNVCIYPFYIDTLDATYRQSTRGLNLANQPQIPINAGVISTVNVPTKTRDQLEAEYEIGKDYLNDLVFLSGGRATAALDLSKKQAVFSSNVPNEIRHQYAITFTPTGKNVMGQRKYVKVRVNRPDLAVLARGSFIVGSSQ